MTNLKKLLLAFSAALLPTAASAEAFTCAANTITFIGTDVAGAVSVSAPFGTFVICNVYFEIGSLKPETCRTWVGQMFSAKSMNWPVGFHFDTARPENATMTGPDFCRSENFQWQLRVPYYMHVAS